MTSRASDIRLFSLLLAVTGAMEAPGIAAQTPAPAPLASPNLDIWAAPQVRAIARLPDGSVIVGGNFTSVYDPATQLSFERINIAKFSASGALDLAWAPRVEGTYVYAIVPDGAGSVFVGGSFWTVDGQPRTALAKLSASGTGTLDLAWNANAGGQVVSLALSASGDLFASGRLFTIGGQTREGIAKLSAATALADPSWNPAPTCTSQDCVLTMLLGADGALYVGGEFTAIGGQTRSNLAKLSTGGTGAADPLWTPGNVDGGVYDLAIAPDGSIFAAGYFSSAGGQLRPGLAKLSAPNGTVDPTWAPPFLGTILSLALDGGGNVVVGGTNGVSRVSASTGIVDPTWNVLIRSGWVDEVMVSPNGVITTAGDFGQANGQAALGLARFTNAGTLLPTSYVQRVGSVNALARASDGSMYVAGDFARAGSFSRQSLLKLGPTGVLDTSWNPNPDGRVEDVKVAPSGAIVVAGNFESIGGVARPYLARISADGAGVVDPAWNPAPNYFTYALAIDANDNVYVGGDFVSIAGQSIARVAKVTAGGTVDPAWNFNPTCAAGSGPCVLSLALDSTGALYVGGFLTSLGGQSRSGLAKIAANGVVDPIWNPAPACTQGFYTCISSLEPDALGNLYVGGSFETIGGQQRQFIARLATSGTGLADATWNPSANNWVLAIQASTSAVYVGGFFDAIGGRPRTTLAKLSTTGVGEAIAGWDPSPVGGLIRNVSALNIGANGEVYVGGQFTQIGGQGRLLLAALPPNVDLIFSVSFE